MSSRARTRRSSPVAATKLKPLEGEESTLDGSFSETTSNSATASHPSSPRLNTPPPQSPSSSNPASPNKRGFVRLDHFFKLGEKRQENIENSAVAIAALTALASGESALIPSWDNCIKERLQMQANGERMSTVVDTGEGSGQLRISLVNTKRRPRKASKKTKIYTF
jgi:hypothetical protein